MDALRTPAPSPMQEALGDYDLAALLTTMLFHSPFWGSFGTVAQPDAFALDRERAAEGDEAELIPALRLPPFYATREAARTADVIHYDRPGVLFALPEDA